MPITVQWDDTDRAILYYCFDGIWTWPELYDAIKISDSMLDEAGRVTPVILDGRKSPGLPREGTLRNLRQIISKFHPNLGYTVIVDDRYNQLLPFTRTMVGLIRRIYRLNWTFDHANTLEDARQMIRDKRQA